MICSSNGFNPMRWDCNEQGCFNKKKRVKIEEFAECFPGTINFTDIDAPVVGSDPSVVEIGRQYLMQEWKPDTCSVSDGQQRLYATLTTDQPWTAYLVCGDPETMEVWKTRKYQNGRQGPWLDMNLGGLKDDFKAWVKEVQENPYVPWTAPWEAKTLNLDITIAKKNDEIARLKEENSRLKKENARLKKENDELLDALLE